MKKFIERTEILQNRIQRIGLDRKGKTDFIGQTSETHCGTTVVIDDRLEVLSHMVESTPHLYLFQPRPEEIKEFEEFLPKVTIVQNWQGTLEVCLRSHLKMRP